MVRWDALAWINQTGKGFRGPVDGASAGMALKATRKWNSSVPARLRGPLHLAFLMSRLGQRNRMHAATFAIDGIPRSDEQHLSDWSGCRTYRPGHTETSEQR